MLRPSNGPETKLEDKFTIFGPVSAYSPDVIRRVESIICRAKEYRTRLKSGISLTVAFRKFRPRMCSRNAVMTEPSS